MNPFSAAGGRPLAFPDRSFAYGSAANGSAAHGSSAYGAYSASGGGGTASSCQCSQGGNV